MRDHLSMTIPFTELHAEDVDTDSVSAMVMYARTKREYNDKYVKDLPDFDHDIYYKLEMGYECVTIEFRWTT
jgi:hypothetical protein